MTEELLITGFTIMGICCYIIFNIFRKEEYNFYTLFNDFKTGIYLVGVLLFLTPVLKSLFVAYSDDTIIIFVVCKRL
jgi:hypothetical protein